MHTFASYITCGVAVASDASNIYFKCKSNNYLLFDYDM